MVFLGALQMGSWCKHLHPHKAFTPASNSQAANDMAHHGLITV